MALIGGEKRCNRKMTDGESSSAVFPKITSNKSGYDQHKIERNGDAIKYHHGNITKKLYHVTHQNGSLRNRFWKQNDAWRFCLSLGLPCQSK
jgi:hypothetical protein